MSLQNIYARIAPNYYQKLSALAEMRNQSISEIIRSIVVAFFESVEEAVDISIGDDSRVQPKQQHQSIENACTQTTVENASPPIGNIDEEEELDW